MAPDSVGALRALNRVFVEHRPFSEEWLEHFRPFVGGQKFAFPDRHRQQELQLLERHRGADAGCGAVLLATAQPDLLARRQAGQRI